MAGTLVVGEVNADVPQLVVDLNFAGRDRLTQLLTTVASLPHALGLGIDEDTTAVVNGSRFEVVGSGAVTVVDGATIHVLPAGYEFELTKRAPVADG